MCLLVNFNETAFVTVVGCNGATVALDFGLDPSKANGLISSTDTHGCAQAFMKSVDMEHWEICEDAAM